MQKPARSEAERFCEAERSKGATYSGNIVSVVSR